MHHTERRVVFSWHPKREGCVICFRVAFANVCEKSLPIDSGTENKTLVHRFAMRCNVNNCFNFILPFDPSSVFFLHLYALSMHIFQPIESNRIGFDVIFFRFSLVSLFHANMETFNLWALQCCSPYRYSPWNASDVPKKTDREKTVKYMKWTQNNRKYKYQRQIKYNKFYFFLSIRNIKLSMHI